MTLNHVHFGTKDLKKIVDFYQKYFGFSKKFDHGEGVFLTDKKGFLIAIDPVEELPTLPDWYHLGFCLDNEKQVQDIYKEMKLNKENIVRDMKRSENEFASFFVRDPDGNKIEVSWHNE
jgi:catechol 2,3-dioxygenase-like lactoylglutathione lyase family enzyme